MAVSQIHLHPQPTPTPTKVAAHLAGVPTAMFCHPDALAAGLALSASAAPPGPLRARLAAEHARRAAAAREIRAATERRREHHQLKRSSIAKVLVGTGVKRPELGSFDSSGCTWWLRAGDRATGIGGWAMSGAQHKLKPNSPLSSLLHCHFTALATPRRSFLPWEWEHDEARPLKRDGRLSVGTGNV